MKFKVQLNSHSQIAHRLGIDSKGRVQIFLTNTINRRIGKYMPHVSGTLENKQKFITSPTTIEVISPAAKYLYYGKRMVDSRTGRGPFFIPNVGYRFRRGATLVPTSTPLHYDKTHNALAGPYWDRRLAAAEKDTVAEEVTRYLRRGGV